MSKRIKYKVFKLEYYLKGQDKLKIEESSIEEKIIIYEIRRSLLFGLTWSLLEPSKDKLNNLDELDSRINTIKKFHKNKGEKCHIDLSECLMDYEIKIK